MILQYAIWGCLFITALVLCKGVFSLFRKDHGAKSNALMQLRVVLQSIVVVLLGLQFFG